MGETEIVPADKRLRRRAVWIAVVLTLAGVVALSILGRHLREIEELAGDNWPAAAEKALGIAAIVAWVAGLSLVGIGCWLWRLGRRVNRAGRYPPPGVSVVKDTPVRTGADARKTAGLAQLAAFVCLVAGTVGMWYLYHLAVTLLRD